MSTTLGVVELRRDLSGRVLDLWRGHTGDGTPVALPPETLAAYRGHFRRSAGLPSLPPADRSRPCRHELSVVQWCPRGDEALHARSCGCADQQDFDSCTRAANGGGHASQTTCRYYRASDPAPGPLRSVRIDLNRLAPGDHGYRFNASMIPYKGRLLLAYRTGWSGSNVAVSEMTPDLVPGGYTVLYGLYHDRAWYGREDPRLFVHKGQLHVSYIGVDCKDGHTITHQMFARLSDDLKVEDVFAPHYPKRASWEKNWQFFDHDNELYAVYSAYPYKVLRIRCNEAVEVFRHAVPLPWDGGHLRGGASPVRVGDEFWCWFHGRTGNGYGARYNVGVLAFEARPPFRPTRITPHPLLWADPASNAAHPDPNYCTVVFPCGAYLEGNTWRVSMGVHDRWIEVADWDHGEVGRALQKV